MSRRITLVLFAALLLAACGDGDEPGAAAGESRYAQVLAGVCEAARSARAENPPDAERAFDDAHTGLHELAAAAESEDRAVAGALLRAKQRVEASLPTPSADDLDALASEVRNAIRVTGDRPPDC